MTPPKVPDIKALAKELRAGSRSAQAHNILRQAGFTRVANLTGGMLRWRGEAFSVEGGAAEGPISTGIDPT